jgi:uncharacterized SAM-binding protein YcdF (DUF218 family)
LRVARSRWVRYLVFVLLLATFGTIVWIKREALLQGVADLWVVSEPITPAEAVVVLGGGADVRPFVAADLYAKGLVQKVLVSQVQETPASKLGVEPDHTQFNVKILRKLGVPENAIELFGHGSQNTWEEALALREWTNQHATSALIVPTEVFFARRARWVFQRTFAGTDVRVEVPSFDPPNGYHRKNWWKTEGGVVTFQNEILKYFYYRLKY